MPNKVAALQNTALPQTKKDLQSFLGLANYYQHIVPQFASRVVPFIDMLRGQKKDSPILHWDPASQATFHALKRAHGTYPVIHTPLPGHPFLLYTDASSLGLGAVVAQMTLRVKDLYCF